MAEGKVAFWKRKSPIDLDQAGYHSRDRLLSRGAI
ncbi:hypothetical protein MEA186_30792 [Mesorhizobium amorphae CCNWGS0123]|uniref:Uncharacterized protein n=1 Tax=Mesorhizobium amorphae CCNWGS0123 TaxID=1082933 RepID=G6YJI1_9HYPH|nr:hypothetical protein MEA186_30792 [Mesorhizobium amorphae CCNWGS0123]